MRLEFSFVAHLSVTLADTGQGSSQALEDADALAHFLAPLTAQFPEEPVDSYTLEASLLAFEAARLPRAHLVQRTARLANGCLPFEEYAKIGKWSDQQLMSYRGIEAELAS